MSDHDDDAPAVVPAGDLEVGMWVAPVQPQRAGTRIGRAGPTLWLLVAARRENTPGCVDLTLSQPGGPGGGIVDRVDVDEAFWVSRHGPHARAPKSADHLCSDTWASELTLHWPRITFTLERDTAQRGVIIVRWADGPAALDVARVLAQVNDRAGAWCLARTMSVSAITAQLVRGLHRRLHGCPTEFRSACRALEAPQDLTGTEQAQVAVLLGFMQFHPIEIRDAYRTLTPAGLAAIAGNAGTLA